MTFAARSATMLRADGGVEGWSSIGRGVVGREGKGLMRVAQVEFRDVSFSYPSRPKALALSSMNLTIRPGKLLALVGLSGSGKRASALSFSPPPCSCFLAPLF